MPSSDQDERALTDGTFIWPEWSEFDDDAKLTIKVTGYEDGAHWTGFTEFTPTDFDYDFWCWVVRHRRLRRGLKDEKAVADLKAQYLRTVQNKPWWRCW